MATQDAVELSESIAVWEESILPSYSSTPEPFFDDLVLTPQVILHDPSEASGAVIAQPPRYLAEYVRITIYHDPFGCNICIHPMIIAVRARLSADIVVEKIQHFAIVHIDEISIKSYERWVCEDCFHDFAGFNT